MILIKSLDRTPFNEIYDAFIDAFSNYEAKMDLTIDQLRKMVVTRSYNPRYSKGYFEEEKLVGFILVGYREQQGQKYFYDAATGIRQEYQKRGIGSALLEEIINEMRVEGIDKFRLEVLENNITAQELYTKQGFRVNRKLCCFEFEMEQLSGIQEYRSAINNDIENDFIEYCSFYPTWQNSNESFNNSRDDYTKIDFYRANMKIGYVIINTSNGNALQLGVGRRNRTNKDVEQIMLCLKREYEIAKIRLLNIEDKSEMDVLLRDFGMNNFINQFEMELKVNRT